MKFLSALFLFSLIIFVAAATDMREPDVKEERVLTRGFGNSNSETQTSFNNPGKSQDSGGEAQGFFNNPGKSQDSGDEAQGFFNNPEKSQNSNSGFFNNPEKSQDSNSVGHGFSNNPGKSNGNGKYGPQGLNLDDLFEDEPQVFENDAKKEVRKYIKDYNKWVFENGYAPTEDFQMTDDYTCTFAGDPTSRKRDYCITIYEGLRPSQDFASVLTIGRIEINGNTAVVQGHYVAKGKAPLLGWDINYSVNSVRTLRYEDGKWKQARNDFLDDETGVVFGQFRSKAMTMLRDSIYSAKQSYPAYNPLVVVGGSAVAGLFGILIVGGWIIKKRRSYKKLDTVTDV